MAGSDVFMAIALVTCTALTTARVGPWLRRCLSRLVRLSPIAPIQLSVLISIPALALIAFAELWTRLRDGLHSGGAAIVVAGFLALLGNGIGLRYRPTRRPPARQGRAPAPTVQA